MSWKSFGSSRPVTADLDNKDVESWRSVFTTDVVVTLDRAVSGAQPHLGRDRHGLTRTMLRISGSSGD
jgi:hypothetical protein